MNNAAAIGYMVIAARRMGLIEDLIYLLKHEMDIAQDEFTEEEAEEAYRNN